MQTPKNELNINSKYLTKSGHIEVGASLGARCKIFYELYGTGPKKIAFLNGMGTDRQMWELLVSHFAPNDGFQVLVYDHRGTGFSEDCSMLSINTLQMAKDANDIFEFLGWEKEINVVGISMGGMIAQELGLMIPDKIRTIVLSSTTSGWTLYKRSAVLMNIRMLFAKMQEEQIELVLNILYPKKWLDAKSIFDSESESETNREFLTKGSLRKMQNTIIHGFPTILGQTLAVLRHHVSSKSLARLGKLFASRKIWIVVGTWDNFIPEVDSRYLAKHIGPDACVLDVFEGTGHSVPTQNHHEFIEKLQRIVDSGEVY